MSKAQKSIDRNEATNETQQSNLADSWSSVKLQPSDNGREGNSKPTSAEVVKVPQTQMKQHNASMKMNRNEVNLIADALNGCGQLIEHDPGYVATMIGEAGAIVGAAIIGRDPDGKVRLTGSKVCSGLEHEIYDCMRLNRLDQKWSVDGVALLEKIRAMSVAERETVIRNVARAWEDPNGPGWDNALAEISE